MGFLNFRQWFAKDEGSLLRLPSGSFTMDEHGAIVASTVPASFPQEKVNAIGQLVLQTFRSAKKAGQPLREMAVTYAALRITGRALGSGAVVFLQPRGAHTAHAHSSN